MTTKRRSQSCCILFRPGHRGHPIQARLASSEPGRPGEVLVDGLEVAWTNGTVISPVRTHHRDRFVDVIERAGSTGWHLSHHLLFQRGGPGVSVAVGDEVLSLCCPEWAESPKKAFRVGQPRSGGPVRRQQWSFDLAWGLGGTAEGGRGWAEGLRLKLLDLAERGPHVVTLDRPTVGLSWRIEVDGHLVARHETPRSIVTITLPISEVEDLAGQVHKSFTDRPTRTHPIECVVRGTR